ncbi:MAG: hypothetical protein ABIP02_04165, partial [Arenimonas sp.]
EDCQAVIIEDPAIRGKADWMARFEQALKMLQASDAAKTQQLQDVEDAEHARDAANLARMKVMGQLNTLHKSLAAALPEIVHHDPQAEALMRIEWLLKHGRGDPEAAAAAKAAEMEAPMPSHEVLEAVVAGKRQFNKEQLEFTIGEVMVLTLWEMTPVELMEKGQPWLAQRVLEKQNSKK